MGMGLIKERDAGCSVGLVCVLLGLFIVNRSLGVQSKMSQSLPIVYRRSYYDIIIL